MHDNIIDYNLPAGSYAIRFNESVAMDWTCKTIESFTTGCLRSRALQRPAVAGAFALVGYHVAPGGRWVSMSVCETQ